MPAPTTADLLETALTLHRQGAFDEAAARYREVLRVDSGHADANYYLGLIACQNGRFTEGVAHAQTAVATNPGHARALVLLARALGALNLRDEALAAIERAIAIEPTLAPAHSHRGAILGELARHAEAIESYDRALALSPDSAEDWFDRGGDLIAVGRNEEAIASFDRAIALRPDFADAHLRRAKLMSELGRHNDALVALDRYLALNAGVAEAWLGRGNILFELKRYDEAVAAFDRALALDPGLAPAWFGRGNVFAILNRRAEAFAAYDRAVALQGDLDYAAGARLLSKLHICDWHNLRAETAQLLAMIRAQKLPAVPFAVLTITETAADQLLAAQRFVRERPVHQPLWRGERYRHDRIKVGYLSADFYDHATANLIAGLFEQHDASDFEIAAISYGPDDGSPMRRRIRNSSARFVDVRDRSDQEAAELIRDLEIDIAVDLKGYTSGGRHNILARRPAPIAVNYLGYPGTMGADHIDYILADETTIPEAACTHYAEQVIWLPDSYQINDDRRAVPEAGLTRDDCALPDGAFVFCCFNSVYKITPHIFDIWMRLIKATPNSVLWLLAGEETASANLRREAANRGVAQERLIFAPRTRSADHLARHRHADLFLDTLPVNAHTTASDALWAGLPVVTCLGETFAGRVAASLLKAAGLDELVTRTLADYEALALELARDPRRLSALKERLLRSRNTCALFDTARTTRQIEAAYREIWERYQRGETTASTRSHPARPIVVRPQ